MKSNGGEVLARNAPAVAVGLGVLALVAWFVNRSSAGNQTGDYCSLANGAGRRISAASVAVAVSRLREALYGGLLWEDEQGAIDALGEVRSNADLFAVACAFGTYAPLLQTDRDLFAALRAFLSASELEALNAALHSQGVTVYL